MPAFLALLAACGSERDPWDQYEGELAVIAPDEASMRALFEGHADLPGCSLSPLLPGRVVSYVPDDIVLRVVAAGGRVVKLGIPGSFPSGSDTSCIAKGYTKGWARDWLNRRDDKEQCDGQPLQAKDAVAHLYVIDTTVEANEEEFKGRLVSYRCGPAGCAATPVEWKYRTDVTNAAHGLWVASVAASSAFGVAPNLNLTTFGVEAERSGGKSLSPSPGAVLCALAEVRRQVGTSPSVVNLSVAFPRNEASTPKEVEAFELIREATESLRKQVPVVVVSALGNDPISKDLVCPVLPAAASDFAVAGIGLAEFGTEYIPTESGRCTAVAAPGKGVQISDAGQAESGTSFAAPLVAGAIAGSWKEGETRDEVIARVKKWQTPGDRYPLFHVPE